MAQKFKQTLEVAGQRYTFYPVDTVPNTQRLPLSLKILVENVLRNVHDEEQALLLAQRIVDAGLAGQTGEEVEFMPARVLFQDFTGVPVFVDFATMREACARLGGDPARINPQIPCDLVIDHSVIADSFGCAESQSENEAIEQERNSERYTFLKWAQRSFQNVRIVPPGKGICHQLNIENFAQVAMTDAWKYAGAAGSGSGAAGAGAAGAAGAGAEAAGSEGAGAEAASASTSTGVAQAPDQQLCVYFDTLVGTDSHTPTANGIGVLGWGVGGIEAEAAALGQPITTLVPRVIGVRLTGQLSAGVSGMDVALKFAQMLRAAGVVGCFVECFGEGVAHLSATQRACISNMTPEYGSTCTLFPVDEKTLEYLRMTGRSDEQVALVEAYAKRQGTWAGAESAEGAEGAGANDAAQEEQHVYAQVIELDLSTIEPCLAGPSRPHDRILLSNMKQRFHEICEERKLDLDKHANVEVLGTTYSLTHGALAIAAVTSCTTATDPAMMLAAGLLAKNAAEKSLAPKPWVKTILAPGSHATQLLLERAGLTESLNKLGFYTCGFGCMSCIGNSGPVLPGVHDKAQELEFASVLSGNRNFEGRISPDVSQNYLTSPALVIAYALAGTMDIDMETQPLGKTPAGEEVYLKDIMPAAEELESLVSRLVTASLYAEGSVGLYEGSEAWQSLQAQASSLFAWDLSSTYVRKAPYFDNMALEPSPCPAVKDAFVLAKLGDFITTDHISPAGAISNDSPAATYLRDHGVAQENFNTYGARRGNHEVLMRGTFANVKLQNQLVPGTKGGYTRDWTVAEGGEEAAMTSIFEASRAYLAQGRPCVVLAGLMYGSGSSRDWAAKGPLLLGVRAVLAKSFERIHRSNLIGMGIVPLQFEEGQDAETLGLNGSERISIEPVDYSRGLPNPTHVKVCAKRADGEEVHFTALVRVDTPMEGAYMRHGGILQYVIRELQQEK